MAYRTIMVDCTSVHLVEERLRVAHALATRFQAALISLHVSPPLLLAPALWQGGWAVHMPPEIVEAQRKAEMEARTLARAAFDRVCGDLAGAIWREVDSDAPGWSPGEVARASDLVVAERGVALEVVSELITTAGVPVLALPPKGVGQDLGQVVLIGWNGSREATRAAHDALPFLRLARRVILCAVGGRLDAALDHASMMLKRHGVPAEPEAVEGSDTGAGEVLLARAAAHGADLLVMGAYGHSRLREFVFGGATHHALRQATLPVLFSS